MNKFVVLAVTMLQIAYTTPPKARLVIKSFSFNSFKGSTKVVAVIAGGSKFSPGSVM